ncbi:pre-60S ribosomal particles component [Coemansia sp. RSA 2052]|nr:pre-60S ribosomal particles component [Coemansia sp. RSA 2052]
MALAAKKTAAAARSNSGAKSKGKFTAKVAKPVVVARKAKPAVAKAEESDDSLASAEEKDNEEEDEEEEEFNDDSEPESASSSADDGDMDVDQSEAESDYDDLAKARKLASKKNTQRGKTTDAEEFSSVLTAILNQDSRDTNAPIMAKDRTRENQIKEELISYKARKALVDEKRMLLNKDRVIPTLENFDYEKKLRKVATRGVIKLFNVIKAQQTELTHITKTPTTRTEKVAEMSKSKFLDLLKAKTS